MGSMFVVVRDEDEERCEYKIVNETQSVDLLYYQFIDKAKIPPGLASLDVSKHLQRNRRLKCGQSYRYSWGSVLHDKLLCVSFTPTFKSFQNDKFTLAATGPSPGFQQRQISKTDLIIPLDKIGLADDLKLYQPTNQPNSS